MIFSDQAGKDKKSKGTALLIRGVPLEDALVIAAGQYRRVEHAKPVDNIERPLKQVNELLCRQGIDLLEYIRRDRLEGGRSRGRKLTRRWSVH
jgi:hypothetical protein